MVNTTIDELARFGQSIWLDNINRTMLENGSLKEMIALGLRGMTSNPSIFEKAVSSSSDYDKRIFELSGSKKTAFEIYDELTVRDIQDAADMFFTVYSQTKGLDGYVSLEVNPGLAHNAKETVKEVKRLYKKVNRPNLMCKVPATKEGCLAIEELTASGININATLIFSLEQYTDAAYAYLNGLESLFKQKINLNTVRSVASVFVSRTDTAVDGLLDKLIVAHPQKKDYFSNLKGKAAAANCASIYKKYCGILQSDKFKELQEKGAYAQRVLWASTSTKNPAYSDIKYVSELIAKNTVNTLPDATFKAFLDHGVVRDALAGNLTYCEDTFLKLKNAGIDIDKILAQLLNDGLSAFDEAFDSLLLTITKKSKELCLKEA
ncbi:MAG: transaldolase [Candidatus Omnitrophota bacterium]|nr:transaldolase [Candidatus Omnitrophota bacterium]